MDVEYGNESFPAKSGGGSAIHAYCRRAENVIEPQHISGRLEFREPLTVALGIPLAGPLDVRAGAIPMRQAVLTFRYVFAQLVALIAIGQNVVGVGLPAY